MTIASRLVNRAANASMFWVVTGSTFGVVTSVGLRLSTPAPFCSGAGGWLPQAASNMARKREGMSLFMVMDSE